MPLASSLATASEFACGLAAAARAPRRGTMMSSDSVCVCVCNSGTTDACEQSVVVMRAPDDTITRCRERCDIYVDTATRACARRGRPEMARPCRPSVRTFFRALLQRALEALLQRGAIPL